MGDTVILSELLLFAGVVALGVSLWGFSLSYVNLSSTKATQDFDVMVAQQRSLLIIEAVSIQASTVWVSNHGLNDVTVISCTIYSKSQASPGIRYNINPLTIRAETNDLAPVRGCEKLPGSPPYVIEVWYIPKHIYDPRDAAGNTQWALVSRYEAG